MWILAKGEDKFREKTISFVPGLYKIFGNKQLLIIYIAIDEILVNAADNIQRDKKTSVIKVNIDQK
jgi:DNA topoisomerase II